MYEWFEWIKLDKPFFICPNPYSLSLLSFLLYIFWTIKIIQSFISFKVRIKKKFCFNSVVTSELNHSFVKQLESLREAKVRTKKSFTKLTKKQHIPSLLSRNLRSFQKGRFLSHTGVHGKRLFKTDRVMYVIWNRKNFVKRFVRKFSTTSQMSIPSLPVFLSGRWNGWRMRTCLPSTSTCNLIQSPLIRVSTTTKRKRAWVAAKWKLFSKPRMSSILFPLSYEF